MTGIEGMIKEMDKLVKEKFKSKKRIPDTKYPGHLEHYEKTKPKNNKNIRIWNQAQRSIKFIQQNHRRKFYNLRKEMPIKVEEAYRTPNGLDKKKHSLST